MTLVIFLVNGSLGISIAVAGTFSLIRFRSATSGSRELIAIFLAMIIGLACGTGYLFLAILFTLFILGVWFLLEHQQIKTDNQRRRLLTITVSNQDKVQKAVQTALDQFCSEVDMITINSSNAGENLSIVYEVELKADADDFQVTSYLTQNIEQCDVTLTKKAKKRKNL